MNKILILVAKEETNTRLAKYLAEELSDSVQVDKRTFDELQIEVMKGQVQVKFPDIDLKAYDLVYFRKTGSKNVPLAQIIALYLAKHGKRFIDSIYADPGTSGNKMFSIVRLAFAEIGVPDSIMMSVDRSKGKKDYIMESLGLPLIVKMPMLQKRKGVYLIQTEQDFDNFVTQKAGRVIFQKYLPIDAEYRLLILGGKLASAHMEEKRIFENNKIKFIPTTGGYTDQVEDKLVETAIAACSALGIDFGGVDVARLENGEIAVFEVNRGPGITQDPAISPEPSAIAQYFKSLLKD